jgi:hypothetical protein
MIPAQAQIPPEPAATRPKANDPDIPGSSATPQEIPPPRSVEEKGALR